VRLVNRVKKVLIIGLDAPIAPRVYNYAVEGKLPALKSLIEGGVYALNCLVPHPTITPPNWTTIVTGTWPGTHGITCFNVHVPGDPLNKTHPGFDTRDCKAEYLWSAAERVGRKTILLNYPSTWPPTPKEGVQIGGAGIAINEWRYEVPPGVTMNCTLADNQLFSTDTYPMGSQVQLVEAVDWRKTPPAARSLQAEFRLQYPRARFKMKEKSWHLLALDSEGKGFDKVLLCRSKDASEAFTVLRPGEWSGILRENFETDQGIKEAVFKCKLIELSEDGKGLKLYVTALCALDGNSYPESVTREIRSEGLPLPSWGVYQALNLGWVDTETFLETIELEHLWLADAATQLMESYPWDLFIMHAHCPDWAYHAFANKVEPQTAKDEKENALFQHVELSFYQSLDRMIGKIMAKAGEEALIIIVSDHGAKATTKRLSFGEILKQAGLTVYRPETDPLKPEIDWSKTKAVYQRSSYVYVNLKGRDPDGIVEPEDYEKVRDQVIEALYEYRDPETGKKPIALALRREDARIMGLYGDRIGDVVIALSPEFGGQHGPHLTTAKWGIGDLKGLLIMKGPGVKKNCLLERTVWLTDVVPTICHLAELPIPRDAEGAVIYQALEKPNEKTEELQQLRKNYERLKDVYEKERFLTHTYDR